MICDKIRISRLLREAYRSAALATALSEQAREAALAAEDVCRTAAAILDGSREIH